MLKVVKQVHFSFHRLRRENFLILRHISGLVNFSLVIDLDVNVNSSYFGIRNASPSNSIGIVIKLVVLIIASIFRAFQRDFNLHKINR